MNTSATVLGAGPHPALPPEPAEAATRCAGWRLVLLRLAWAAIALLCLGASAAGFVALLDQQSLDVLFRVGVFALNPQLPTVFDVLGVPNTLVLRADFLFRLLGLTVFMVTAAVIFLRKSRDWMTGLVSITLATLGATVFAPLEVLAASNPGWVPVVRLLGIPEPNSPLFGRSIGGLAFLLFLYLFPDGRFVPPWTKAVAAAVAGHVLLWVLLPNSFLAVDRWPNQLLLTWIVLIPASGLFAQFYRYVTETSSSQRRQTRLVVIALGVMAAVPSLLIVVTPELGEGLPGLALVTPRVEALYELILLLLLALALLTLPLSIAVSVLRYRLWDIDLLVNRALVYGSLTATLGAAYVATVVLLQQVFSPVTQRSTIAVAISTLAFAALFQPARDRFQAIIDRRFNRRKYDAEQTIVAFSSRLREEVNLDSLADDLLNVVDETMEPSHVSLWLRPTTEAAEA
jgi:hypothetical protein